MPRDKAKLRVQVAKEILETEKTYVEQLDTLISLYLGPLRKSLCDRKPKLKEKYVKILFRNVVHIRGIHTTFMMDIKKIKGDPADSFGELFARFAHFFKMYTDYVNEHEAASNALAYVMKASKYQAFHDFCMECAKHPMSKGLNLSSLLITPIQRIPRYKLLLTELLKNTNEDHKDRKNLVKAIDLISATAKHINEAVRSYQNRKEIQQCMDEFVGSENLLEPHRKFIRKGELVRQTRNKVRPFMFYLFNDLLIYASPRGWKYRVHLKAPIDTQFKIEVYGAGTEEELKKCGPELQKAGSALKARMASEYPRMYLWQIQTKKKSFIVFAPTQQLGSSWVKDLLACKERARKTIFGRSATHAVVETAPVWQPDSEARACMVCSKPFGFIRRRHHCRKCGLLVCSDCSKGRAILSWCPGDGKQRVCDKCLEPNRRSSVTRNLGVSSILASTKSVLPEVKEETNNSNKSPLEEKTPVSVAVSPPAKAPVAVSNPVGVSFPAPSSVVVSSPATREDEKVPNPTISPQEFEKKSILESNLNTTKVSVTTEESEESKDGLAPPASPRLSRFSILRLAQKGVINNEVPEVDSKAREDVNFNVLSDWIWIPHKQKGFVAGKLVSENKENKVFRTIEGEEIVLKIKEAKGLRIAGERVREGDMEDLTMLTNKDFSEGSLLNILRTRYKRDEIYTTMGGILVAINPLRMLPIYTMEILNKYKTAQPHELSTTLPPHVFAVAAEAFSGLVNDRVAQSVVISGESGSGKTETTKLILQFLSEVADSRTGVEQELLQSNPLLEAFGNAKTLRNNNSSRFGKWMAIKVQLPSARICGGAIQHYLLEKTRVVIVQPRERNYHIFYQLCAFATSKIGTKSKKFRDAGKWAKQIQKIIDRLEVLPAERYHYLNQGGDCTVDDYDDAAEFLHTMACMEQCGIPLDQTHKILQLLTGILHLGNVRFEKKGRANVDAKSLPDLRKASRLLGVKTDDLNFSLVHRTIAGKGKHQTLIPLKASQANDARDALAKAIYSGIFDWLVATLNQRLNRAEGKLTPPSGERNQMQTVGVLDIFGFEVFTVNSLEQLFINYANEKLQQFFNQYVFKSEQALYNEEGLSVESVTFNDNQKCLTLIEGIPKKKFGAKAPASILKILDECIKMPNPTDAKLLQRIIDTHNTITSTTNKNPNANPHFAIPRGGKRDGVFVIKHYSGDVKYNVKGFLDKNRDHVHLSLKDLLRGSSSSILNRIFPEEKKEDENNIQAKMQYKTSPRSFRQSMSMVQQIRQKERAYALASKKKSKKKHASAITTLGSGFRSSIRSLINSLRETNPFFIRCIKPNSEKRPFHFAAPVVLRQMRNSGLVEALGIRRLGFPYRKTHEQFLSRYISIQTLFDEKSNRMVNKDEVPPPPSPEYTKGGNKKTACRALVRIICLLGEKERAFPPNAIQMGKTKVFWTGAARRALENWRQLGYISSTKTLQAALRAVLGKRTLNTSIEEGKKYVESGNVEEKSRRDSVPAPKMMSDLSVQSLMTMPDKNDGGLNSNEKDLYISTLKTKHLYPMKKYQDNNPDYLKGLFLNRSSAKKSRFIFQRGAIPSSLLIIRMSHMEDRTLARMEERALRKKAVSTFENTLRYMTVKFHAYPVTTGFAVVSAGHAEPALRDEIFCQLIKQTTETPKEEWQMLGFKLLYLCLSAFMPKRCTPVLLSHIAMYCNPDFEEKLPDTITSVQDIATHCLRLFIANRQLEEMELRSNYNSSTGLKEEKKGNGEESSEKQLYVTLAMVRRVTKGIMTEEELSDVEY
mmetsp:Transcript_21476/g.31947  ORF Transcript_21476/g.31947 Transcript_21476/m.31947 type:complete len:1779 (+) Transcript_21476:65-5401(+)